MMRWGPWRSLNKSTFHRPHSRCLTHTNFMRHVVRQSYQPVSRSIAKRGSQSCGSQIQNCFGALIYILERAKTMCTKNWYPRQTFLSSKCRSVAALLCRNLTKEAFRTPTSPNEMRWRFEKCGFRGSTSSRYISGKASSIACSVSSPKLRSSDLRCFRLLRKWRSEPLLITSTYLEKILSPVPKPTMSISRETSVSFLHAMTKGLQYISPAKNSNGNRTAVRLVTGQPASWSPITMSRHIWRSRSLSELSVSARSPIIFSFLMC